MCTCVSEFRFLLCWLARPLTSKFGFFQDHSVMSYIRVFNKYIDFTDLGEKRLNKKKFRSGFRFKGGAKSGEQTYVREI